jgi:hypothetical protein
MLCAFPFSVAVAAFIFYCLTTAGARLARCWYDTLQVRISSISQIRTILTGVLLVLSGLPWRMQVNISTHNTPSPLCGVVKTLENTLTETGCFLFRVREGDTCYVRSIRKS